MCLVQKTIGILAYAVNFIGNKCGSLQFLLATFRSNFKNSNWRGIPLSKSIKFELKFWSFCLMNELAAPISCFQTLTLTTDASIPTKVETNSPSPGGLGFCAILPNGKSIYSHTTCVVLEPDDSVSLSTTTYELLAIDWALYSIVSFILPGLKVIVQTDSKNATFLKGDRLTNAIICSEISTVPIFTKTIMSIEHISAEMNLKCDCISRIHTGSPYTESFKKLFGKDDVFYSHIPIVNFPFSARSGLIKDFADYYPTVEAKHKVKVFREFGNIRRVLG